MKASNTWQHLHGIATSGLISDVEALFVHWSNINRVGYGYRIAQNKKPPKTLKMKFKDEKISLRA